MTQHSFQKTFYRTHSCGHLRQEHIGQQVILSGWIHRKRDHGSLLFFDLRDHYGLTQCLLEDSHPSFSLAQDLSLETVLSLKGRVVSRSPSTINAQLATGEVEVVIEDIEVLSRAEPLPMPVHTDLDYPEETRLTYRFLDLRRPHVHQAMVLRSQVIAFMRALMLEQGFLEIQTPILTATSPEGARDYVVPSRLYPGEFYALPQAPQQFKQLLMASGFDKYFQIAPCFRDEASRADRSPGEFYQLDMEMAFVSQEDVWQAIEPVLYKTFAHFAPQATITSPPFPRIPYAQALLEYGSDKPDLRNPLRIKDYTSTLCLPIFHASVGEGAVVRGIVVPPHDALSRRFLKDLTAWALEQGVEGLGYIHHAPELGIQGPLVKFCDENQQAFLQKEIPVGGYLFLNCAAPALAASFMGKVRTHLGTLLNLIEPDLFSFCWITDFPMYEQDEETGAIIFSHNPFSMPQGGMEALMTQDPLSIKAYQYDIVCNGIELSSGAIRNHLPEVMYKAFEIAGYSKEHVAEQFGALLKAFHYGVPPHGGSAPGVDRIVMLLAGTPNIREVIPFPLNQQARDLMMGAPCLLSASRLNELHLTIKESRKK